MAGCPFALIEPSHNTDGGRRVEKAVTEAREKKTDASEFERRRKRRGDRAEADQQMPVKRGLAHAEAVGAAEGSASHR
jgi:hypothetical protein